MQTFLPYPEFSKSAECLDNKRLGKQRVETWQIYKALTEENYGWKNHPAVKMWKGYEHALLVYGSTICKEWIKRGFRDTMLERFNNERFKITYTKDSEIENPPWFGQEDFHTAHRSNLLRKDYDYYSKFNWLETADLEYVWPEA